ncbi:16S rRNA (cytidine(1402)-2'-O)-methyltransferase [Salinicoccus albus]|uniref:16S rRNA (cytidine(1402)-2'-O)-methyltransferase n=1 Tax=Salinicoccus albus TaxID=418756 RepID=UPI00035E6F7D|nr:16S rRNA (cytidine(1402)-2'-O)-methyltransferase [Salinicoccus albus]
MHLYVTGTPLGNLDDMSYRAVDTLKNVDIILCEDTRVTRKLTNHFDIDTPLQSYHDFNKEEAEAGIIEAMKAGKVFALVSDAGMPVVSDPGFELINRMQAEGLGYVTIPSASAFTLALVASGIPSFEFTYFGFLPKTGRKRKEKLTEIMNHHYTSVLYESPHKISSTVSAISDFDPDRAVSISREITKKFEQHKRGAAREMHQLLGKEIPLKGEFVIVIEGAPEETISFDIPVNDHVEQFVGQGLKPKEAIKKVADLRGLKKQDVYDIYHKN